MGEAGELGERLAWLRAAAAAEGIEHLAVASPARAPSAEIFDAWLGSGEHAGMAWIERQRERRLSPELFLPGVASVVSVAWNYLREQPAQPPPPAPRAAEPERTSAPAQPAGEAPALRIARYAWGEDYHRVLRAKLERIVARLRERRPSLVARVAVDSSPVQERHWAAQGGLGWIGRNRCLIVPGIGSWVVLGEIFLDLELPAGEPLAPRCGECRRCLEACPGGALREGRPLDARRCIAYWTVEHPGAFPEEDLPPLAPWLYGCDLCQEVCPWNVSAPVSDEPLAGEIAEALRWSPAAWASLGEEAFVKRFGGTPLGRLGYARVLRNAEKVSGPGARRGSGPRARESQPGAG